MLLPQFWVCLGVSMQEKGGAGSVIIWLDLSFKCQPLTLTSLTSGR